MEQIENHCVGCQLPCLYSACPYYEVTVHYCDQCYKEEAKYEIEGEDFCEDCAKEYFRNLIDDIGYREIAKKFDISFYEYD